MFGDQHKNHQFEKLQKIYQIHLQKIIVEKDVLDDKLGEMNLQFNKLNKQIDAIINAKMGRLREIDKYIENIHETLENQVNEKMLKLSSAKEELTKSISKFLHLLYREAGRMQLPHHQRDRKQFEVKAHHKKRCLGSIY
jgi:hypothetical protein